MSEDRFVDPTEEKPEADVSEQAQPAGGDADDAGVRPSHDPEAPEADALEQRLPVRPPPGDMPDVATADAAEADLLDQARAAELDDEEEPR